MPMGNMQAEMEALTKAVAEMRRHAKGVGAEFDETQKSVIGLGKLITGVTIGEFVKDYARQLLQQQRSRIKVIGEEYAIQKDVLKLMKDELKALVDAKVKDETLTESQRKMVKAQKEKLGLLAREFKFRTAIDGLWSRQGIVLGSVAALFVKTLDTAHDYNLALTQANTDFRTRFGLIQQTLSVQTELGASTRSMAEAAEALVNYGHDLTPAFRENLKVVTMLHNGLGIAANTGAELVTIFTRQLRAGAEQVGDVMAQVAAQTGLSAQRAAEFAIEIGRSLRLLGPGFKTEAAGVTRVIEMMAGRVQELGGNASAVVNMFKQMSGGTSQAFFLRGLAGGARPGQLGTETGAEQAMRGLEKRISQILTAPEGTEMYVAQLEAVAEMTGMASGDIIDFREAIKSLNVPMSEAKALQKAYSQQTALLGESFGQVREAIQALLVSAVMPLMPGVTGASKAIAGFARLIASWKPLIVTTQIVLVGAAVAAALAIKRLASELRGLALSSEFAKKLTGSGGLIGNLTNLLGKSKWAGFGGPALGVAAAGALGYAVGSAIEPYIHSFLPHETMGKIAALLGRWYGDTKVSNSLSKASYSSGRYSSYQDAKDTAKQIQEAVHGGAGPQEVTRQLNALMNRVNAMMLGKGNPAAARDYAIEFARRLVVDQASLAMLRRAGTMKSEDEMREDRAALAEIQMLKVLQAQLVEQEKIRRAAAEQNEAAQRTLREQVERSHGAKFSGFPPPDALSNRAAFPGRPE